MSIEGIDLSLIADFAAHYSATATAERDEAITERNSHEWDLLSCRSERDATVNRMTDLRLRYEALQTRVAELEAVVNGAISWMHDDAGNYEQLSIILAQATPLAAKESKHG